MPLDATTFLTAKGIGLIDRSGIWFPLDVDWAFIRIMDEEAKTVTVLVPFILLQYAPEKKDGELFAELPPRKSQAQAYWYCF